MPGRFQIEGRNGEVWRRHTIYGWTQERIAQHFGISQERVSQILIGIRKKINPIIQEEMAQNSLELLRDIQARALEIADMTGAPVAVGKDGDILREPGCLPNCELDHEHSEEGAVVRDYSGRLRALETAAKMDAEIAKRFGLNAPEKREVAAVVKYEVANVDIENLT